MLLSWFTLLPCLCINAENTAVFREPDEEVVFECSSVECSTKIGDYVGMYLYRDFKEREEVLYYHSHPGPEKITVRARYKFRAQKEGSLKNHTITISDLNVNDTGLYSCVYRKDLKTGVTCNVYILVVRNASRLLLPSSEKHSQLVLITIAAFAVSILVTMIFILVIVRRVKQWTSRRKRATITQPVPNDTVYEVMTNNGFRPAAAPE